MTRSMVERLADNGFLLQIARCSRSLRIFGEQQLDRQPPLVAIIHDGPDLAGLARLDDVQQPVGADMFLTCQCHGCDANPILPATHIRRQEI